MSNIRGSVIRQCYTNVTGRYKSRDKSCCKSHRKMLRNRVTTIRYMDNVSNRSSTSKVLVKSKLSITRHLVSISKCRMITSTITRSHNLSFMQNYLPKVNFEKIIFLSIREKCLIKMCLIRNACTLTHFATLKKRIRMLLADLLIYRLIDFLTTWIH